MTATIILQSASYRLDLNGGVEYGIGYGGGVGTPEVNTLFAPVWGGYHDPLVGVDYANRTASLPLHIKGTSGDNWIINAQQLDRCLLDARTYQASGGDDGDAAELIVQLDNWTYPVVFDVLDYRVPHGDSILQFTMKSSSAPVLPFVPVTLILKPFARTQQMVRSVSGTLNNGGGAGTPSNSTFTVTAPAGDVPMPCRLTFQSASGDPFQRVFIGKKSRNTPANFPWIIQSEEGTFTGYTVTDIEGSGNLSYAPAVDATASDGNVGRVTFTATAADVDLYRVALNDNLLDCYGVYRTFQRVQATAQITEVIFQLKYGGGSGTDISNDATVAVSTPSQDLFDTGIIEIPHRDTQGVLATYNFVLEVSGTVVSNPDTLDLDCTYLLPIDEGYADVTTSAAASAQDQLVFDGLLPEPTVYLLDSSGDSQPEQLTGVLGAFDLTPGRDNIFYTLFTRDATEPALQQVLGDQYTLTVEYFPLFVLGRTA